MISSLITLIEMIFLLYTSIFQIFFDSLMTSRPLSFRYLCLSWFFIGIYIPWILDCDIHIILSHQTLAAYSILTTYFVVNEYFLNCWIELSTYLCCFSPNCKKNLSCSFSDWSIKSCCCPFYFVRLECKCLRLK